MIAVSDVVLITVSAAALATGVFRWQENVEHATRMQQPALVAPEIQQPINGSSNNLPTGLSASNQSNIQAASADTSDAAGRGDSSQLVVVDEQQTALIDAAADPQTQLDNQSTVDLPSFGTYTVQPGDSLSLIADRYDTTVQTLQQVNDINGSLINVGQQIRYPQ